MLVQTLPPHSPQPADTPSAVGRDRVVFGQGEQDGRFRDELTRASSRRSAEPALTAQETRSIRADSSPSDKYNSNATPVDDAPSNATNETPDKSADADDPIEPVDDSAQDDAQPVAVDTRSDARPHPTPGTDTKDAADASGQDATPHAARSSEQSGASAKSHAGSGEQSRGGAGDAAAIRSESDAGATNSEMSDGEDGFSNSNGSKQHGQPIRVDAQSAGINPDDLGADRQDTMPAKPAASEHVDLGALEAKAGGAASVLQLEIDSASSLKGADPSAKLTGNTVGQPVAHAEGPDDGDGAFRAGVSRGLAAALQQKGGSLTIRLSPESLGSLRIQMTLEEGSVSVRMETLNEHARQMLMRSMPMLRESLENKGLTVRDLQVTPALAHTPSASSAPHARHDAQQDGNWNEGRESHDQQSGDRDGDGQQEDGSPNDQPGAGDGMSEHWFEQRLRMTLNTVA